MSIEKCEFSALQSEKAALLKKCIDGILCINNV